MSSQEWIEKAANIIADEISGGLDIDLACNATRATQEIAEIIRQAYAPHCASLPQLQEMAKGIANSVVAELTLIHYVSMNSVDVGDIEKKISTRLAPLYAELERLARYEKELERAASLLQGLLSIGQVKAIGLLEVASGVERLGQEKREDSDRKDKLLGECRQKFTGDFMAAPSWIDLLTRIDAETGGSDGA